MAKYAVVQFQETWSRGQHCYYILIYDKKMLQNYKKTAEDVKIQRIEIEYNYLMSINTTSLLFAERKSWPSKGQDLGVLNFWVERNPLGLKEEGDKDRQAE